MLNLKRYLNTRGSIWRKWDLHIHAPGTALNDLYKNDWEAYIRALADLKDIPVLGITDYYGLEGYLKVKEAKEQGRLDNIDLIIPNIEVRLDIYSKDGKPINYHILFSPEVDKYIKTHFLDELEFTLHKRPYKCSEEDIIELGEVFLDDDASPEMKYKEGIQQFKVSIDDITDILERYEGIFKNKYILAVPNSSKDGASGIRVAQYRGVKENIYKKSNVIFSSNPRDKDFFSYKNEKAMNMCGKLMPCIHGSDAHSLEEVGNPDLNRYTWIKADPTFDGLMQILYEPEYRVVVQQNHPDDKIDYNVIDKVQFLDENDEFTTDPIYLNSYLNVIIGGKSSGKSALMYKIAQAISLEAINGVQANKNWTNIYKDTFIDHTNFKVTFKSGQVFTKEESNGRVQYIPQMYINKISEDRNNRVLQEKIKEILDASISNTDEFLKVNERIKQIEQETRTQVDLLIDQINRVLNTREKVHELPSEKEVFEEIKEIETKIQMAVETAKLTDEETEKYESNIEEVKIKELELNKSKAAIKEFILKTDKIKSTLTKTIIDLKAIKFKEEDAINIFEKFLSNMETSKSATLEELKKISKQYEIKEKKLIKEINQLNKAREPIDAKLKKSNTIPEDRIKLKEQQKILEEIQKVKLTLDEEKEVQGKIETEVFNLKNEQIESLVKIKELIKTTEISNNLRADAIISFANDIFDDKFLDLFMRRGKINNTLKNPEDEVILNNKDEFNFNLETYIDNIKYLYRIVLNTPKEELNLKSISNKRSLFEALLKESYIDVQYDLVKDNDSLYQMSPGNRGLVLLELFLHMSEDLYPILIDQPEDNLDNRTISTELVKIIKEQKNKRQIIIVTHNANLAVLTDAENVIVANQDHSLEYNVKKRFEYITGSLECSFEENKGKKFNDKGIKEHTSEILEGGEEAFAVRGKKYGYTE